MRNFVARRARRGRKCSAYRAEEDRPVNGITSASYRFKIEPALAVVSKFHLRTDCEAVSTSVRAAGRNVPVKLRMKASTPIFKWRAHRPIFVDVVDLIFLAAGGGEVGSRI